MSEPQKTAEKSQESFTSIIEEHVKKVLHRISGEQNWDSSEVP
jgi:hypothetical protein